MGVNRGKEFETIIKKTFESMKGVSIDRYQDSMSGFLGVRSFCDFGIYKHPFLYYIECKTVSGNTLNFKSNISKNQWEGLIKKTKIEGVFSGILVWFIKHDITIFVPIQELQRLSNEGEKALNIKNIKENTVFYVELEGRKKRVFFNYSPQTFFETLNKKGKKFIFTE